MTPTLNRTLLVSLLVLSVPTWAHTPAAKRRSPQANARVSAIDPAQLDGLCASLNAEPFSRDRLQLLAREAPRHLFLVSQVQQILSQFDFSNDRLEAARLLRTRILDSENHALLYGAFEFSVDKERLRQILGS